MLIVQRTETDPYFNLAAEEFLLKNFKEDIFSLWVNSPCLVVGKHQNALAEINYPLVRQTGLPVVRRITGGGTVYQDAGNLNYSFIVTGEKEKLVDYSKYTRPVIDFLSTLGIQASLEGKSNLVIEGKKFSGNSAHVFKNRVIHHGTILFDSDLDMLHNVIHRKTNIYRDNSVKSTRAGVCNVAEYLRGKMTIGEFSGLFAGFIRNNNPGAIPYQFSEAQRVSISELADEKYRTHAWNFDHFSDYNIENELSDGNVSYKIHLQIRRGIIVGASIINSKSGTESIPGKILLNLPHQEVFIHRKLEDFNFTSYFKYISLQDFIDQIF